MTARQIWDLMPPFDFPSLTSSFTLPRVDRYLFPAAIQAKVEELTVPVLAAGQAEVEERTVPVPAAGQAEVEERTVPVPAAVGAEGGDPTAPVLAAGRAQVEEVTTPVPDAAERVEEETFEPPEETEPTGPAQSAGSEAQVQEDYRTPEPVDIVVEKGGITVTATTTYGTKSLERNTSTIYRESVQRSADAVSPDQIEDSGRREDSLLAAASADKENEISETAGGAFGLLGLLRSSPLSEEESRNSRAEALRRAAAALLVGNGEEPEGTAPAEGNGSEETEGPSLDTMA